MNMKIASVNSFFKHQNNIKKPFQKVILSNFTSRDVFRKNDVFKNEEFIYFKKLIAQYYPENLDRYILKAKVEMDSKTVAEMQAGKKFFNKADDLD